jgi:hypothetical protein
MHAPRFHNARRIPSAWVIVVLFCAGCGMAQTPNIAPGGSFEPMVCKPNGGVGEDKPITRGKSAKIRWNGTVRDYVLEIPAGAVTDSGIAISMVGELNGPRYGIRIVAKRNGIPLQRLDFATPATLRMKWHGCKTDDEPVYVAVVENGGLVPIPNPRYEPPEWFYHTVIVELDQLSDYVLGVPARDQ